MRDFFMFTKKLMSENTFHTEQFTIRANEVDTSGTLTLPAICTFFQEVAGNNAKALNFDITDMEKQNLTWVLQRMDINMHSSIKWRDTIIVETWPAAGDSLRAYRNYRIVDTNKQEIGHCLSYWMAMNLNTRRPTRIPQSVLDTRFEHRPHVSEVKRNKIKPFTNDGNKKRIIVRRSDLDMNNHVNNVRYCEWMLETVSQDISQKIKNFEILFLRETFVDEQLISESYIENNGIQFKITNSNGKVISVAEAKI